MFSNQILKLNIVGGDSHYVRGKIAIYVTLAILSFPLYYLTISRSTDLFLLFLSFIIGIYLLAAGSDYFVEGASGIAKHYRVSEHTIGLTLVALATSLPELAVSDIASLYGHGETAWGNVVGSNIANIGLVLGIAAIIMPLRLSTYIRRDAITLALVTTLILLFVLLFSTLVWWMGVVFLIVYGLYVNEIRGRKEEEVVESNMNFIVAVAATIFGAIGIVWGAKMLVESAIGISIALHIPEIIIAITAVALGTSLPELATTIAATLKRKHGIAVGNIIGSNIFNALVVLGTASIIHPIAIPRADIYLSLFFFSLSAYALTIFAIRKKLGNFEGLFFLISYIIFIILLII